MTRLIKSSLLAAAFALAGGAAYAADAPAASTSTVDWNAVGIFAVFVLLTLGITYWAAQRTRTAKDFYAAGGGITGFQNGLAIAGDYMSAASFLGISALVYSSGYYGLIYSIGFLVGWPIIMFLMAEPLRNLGRYTFADVASYRLQATPIRAMAATGTLVTVAFYLIAQMVGAGQLIELLFGLPYLVAVVLVGVLMVIYVTFGGMIATTWVQIIKATLLLIGATLMAILVLNAFDFDFNALLVKAIEVHPQHDKIMLPGAAVANPISAISLGMALMFGTAGLPHILMRFFTVGNAKEARKSVFWATTFIGYFYILTFIIGFGAIVMVGPNAIYHVGGDIAKGLLGGGNMPAIHLAHAVGGDLRPTTRRGAEIDDAHVRLQQMIAVVHLQQLIGGAGTISVALGARDIGVVELALQPQRRGQRALARSLDSHFQRASARAAVAAVAALRHAATFSRGANRPSAPGSIANRRL